MDTQKNKTKRPFYKRWWFIAFAVIFLVGIINSLNEPPKNTSTGKSQTNSSKEKEATKAEKGTSVLDYYDVTYWDSGGNFATKDSLGPLEVLVNSGLNQFSDCFGAKRALRDVMAEIYADPVLKNKVSRVLFTAPHYLRASLGSSDGTKFTWAEVFPSYFWSSLLKFKSYEDESGPLTARTWGKDIGGCK